MTAPVLTSKLDRESPEAKARFDHNKSLAGPICGPFWWLLSKPHSQARIRFVIIRFLVT